MKTIVTVLSLGIVLLVQSAVAQNWMQTNGPSGSAIRSLAVGKNGELFVLADVLLGSTDGGQSWKQLATGFPAQAASALVSTPRGDLFLLVDNSLNFSEPKDGIDDAVHGIWRSSDLGVTWTRVLTAHYQFLTLMASPDSSVHVSRFGYDNTKGDFELYSFRTTDNGVTWDSALVMPPTSGNVMIWTSGADANGNLYHCTTGFVYRSTNQGKSWSKIVNGLSQSDFRSISFSPNGDVYLGGTGNGTYGFFRSSDGGRTWTRLIIPNGDDGNIIGSAVNAYGRVLFAGYTHLFYSDDSGKTWPSYSYIPDERGQAAGLEHAIYSDGDSGFYVGARGCLFHKSRPGSTSFEQLSLPMAHAEAVACHPDGSLLSSTGYIFNNDAYFDALWRSSDNGITWGQVFDSSTSIRFFPTAFAIDSQKNMILGTQSGQIFLSTNSGLNWKQNKTTLTQGLLTSLIVRPDGDIFASSSTEGVFRSSDNGATWDQLNDGITAPQIYSLAVNQSNNVFAGGDGGMFKTTDDGISWQQLTVDTLKGRVTALVVSLQGNVIAAMSGAGMYESADNGTSWVTLGAGLPTTVINCLLVTPSGIVFAGTDSGVFQLLVGAANWQPYNLGLTTKNVLSLTRNANGQIFAGTDGCGVFSSLQMFNKIQNSVRTVAGLPGISIVAPYPNPGRGNCSFGFTNSETISMKIECVDITGRVIAVIADGNFFAGEHPLSLDLSSFAAGYYGLRFISGQSSETFPVIVSR